MGAHANSPGADSPAEQAKRAFHTDDAAGLQRLFTEHPELKAMINAPVCAFDSPPIIHARSRAMLDVLLAAGADINARSRWWAGGFGLLDSAKPELAAYAIERGATVDAHAAARLGLMPRLRELVAANPALVHARGGDGQTPLHFAGTVEVAEFLLAHGADLNARDVDHESTPAQWMVKERPEVARFLVSRGCQTDLLLVSALGDLERVRQHLDADPGCIRMRVTNEYFPRVGGKAGGTIYQWTLGWYVSAHAVAKAFGHPEVLRLLIERSPAEVKLLALVLDEDEAGAKALLAAHPGLVAQLSPADQSHLAHAARNNQLAVVRLMLACGWPVDARGQHGGMALHWAAFHGNAAMTEAILPYHPPLEVPDLDHRSTPMGWAVFGSMNGWHSATGNYAGTVEALLRAGAKLPGKLDGSEAVQAVLRRHGVQ
ncbi:MAG TPA: ankyrin repeat domain-containing protein [Candidatus Limnocylindria bacterium]|nr:ankyrin repeat domain-containing protein [Candidatus Limnocylindria bacterium]